MIFIKKERKSNDKYILIFDDTLNTYQCIQKFPSQGSLRFEISRDLDSALEHFRRKMNDGFLYDLIILDCSNPKSFDFAFSIRETEKNIKEHFCLCGLYSEKATLNDWKTVGLDREVARPLDEMVLRKILEEMSCF